MRREMLQGRLDARAGEEGGGSCSEGYAQSYRLQHVQVVLPAPLVHWCDGRTGIAGEVVAAPVISVRLPPRATAPQTPLHHRRPVGVGEREAGHRA